MKKTLKITSIVLIVVVIAGAAVGAVAYQQMRKPGAGMFGFLAKRVITPDMVLTHFRDRLNLTEEQEAQLHPILQEAIDKRMAEFQKFRGQGRHGDFVMNADRQQMWQELETKLAEVLTEEQMQALRTMYQKGMGMRMEMFGRMMQTRGEFQQLLADLNISDEQKQELFTIFMKYQENRGNAMDLFLENRQQLLDTFLNEDFDEAKVRQTYKDITAKFEDYMVERAKMLNEMKAVLTPEQLELLKQKAPELLTNLQEHLHRGRSMANPWLQK